MSICEEWETSKRVKDSKVKMATTTILIPSFWNDVVYTLKGHSASCRCAKKIKGNSNGLHICRNWGRNKLIEKAFNLNSSKCKAVFEIIDKKWECQLHHPLHVAGYYLNPEYYYDKLKIKNDLKLVRHLRKCIETLSKRNER